MRVSASIGYQHNGSQVQVVEGRRRVEQRLVLDLDDWRSRSRPHVDVEGLDACREMFGA